ncbi:MAG TPA: hypothetical protein VNE67_16060 [Acetobacteraceae bacterium]|nr:hypothetical protein [Acetobacteraceae bacterium]
MTRHLVALMLIAVGTLVLAACSDTGRFAAPPAGPMPSAYSGSDGGGGGSGM